MARMMWRGAYTQTALAWAESHELPALLLSPGMGAVNPTQKVAPDLQTKWANLSPQERENWAKVTAERVRGELPDGVLVSFLSSEWNDLLTAQGLTLTPAPPESLQAPQRMAWMMENMGDATPSDDDISG